MPPWLEIAVSIAAAIAAVFFFAKYRETAAALHESDRIKNKLSKDLDRYRDVPQLRALRDGVTGERNLPVDDEGYEHVLIRNAERKLVHVKFKKVVHTLADGEAPQFSAGGEARPLQELD